MYKVWLCGYDHHDRSASLSRRAGDRGAREDGLSSQGFSGQDALEQALNWLVQQGEKIVSILPLDRQMMTGPYAYVITEPIGGKRLKLPPENFTALLAPGLVGKENSKPEK
jgi:hypothetical protein